MKMGLGRKTISAYKNKHNLTMTIALPAVVELEEVVVPKKRKRMHPTLVICVYKLVDLCS